MSRATIQHIAVNVPELLLHITQYLDYVNIIRCMATCKTLARHMEPSLWQYLTIGDKSPPRESMMRNRYLIRTINIRHMEGYRNCLEMMAEDEALSDKGTVSSAEDNPENQPITKLHTLTFGYFPQHLALQLTIAKTFVSLAHRSRYTLRTLTLPTLALSQADSVDVPIRDTLANHLPNLNHLTIGHGGFLSWDRAIQFLMLCFHHPQLTSLHCYFCVLGIGYSDQLQDELEALQATLNPPGGTRVSRIKDLRLPSAELGYTVQTLTSILKIHGANLESLSLPGLARRYTPNIQESEGVLERAIEELIPNVCHVWIDRDKFGLLHESTIAAFIRGYRNKVLTSFHLSGVMTFEEAKVIENLVDYHADTLEVVEFRKRSIFSRQQYLVLQRCVNLKRLWVDFEASQHVNENTLRIGNRSTDWVCLNLKELRLVYTPEFPEVKVRGLTLKRQPSTQLYTQIGRLIHLEYLGIGGGCLEGDVSKFDMTIRRGWLGLLNGLRKLKHLCMITGLWYEMGRDEIEFMHQNWPALHTVTFYCDESGLEAIRKQPHWMWLCQRRPWLQLTREQYP